MPKPLAVTNQGCGGGVKSHTAQESSQRLGNQISESQRRRGDLKLQTMTSGDSTLCGDGGDILAAVIIRPKM